MGYTHYFKFTKFITKEQMEEVAKNVKDVFGTFPMVAKRLKGPYGEGKPIITGKYGISFNGDAEGTRLTKSLPLMQKIWVFISARPQDDLMTWQYAFV